MTRKEAIKFHLNKATVNLGVFFNGFDLTQNPATAYRERTHSHLNVRNHKTCRPTGSKHSLAGTELMEGVIAGEDVRVLDHGAWLF